MTIQCPNCQENLELPSGITEGQHVRCPCCNAKFSFTIRTTNNEELTSLLPNSSFSVGQDRDRFVWRRWWARIVDLLPLSLILSTWFFAEQSESCGQGQASVVLLVMLLVVYPVSAIGIEVLMYQLFGNSFGKWVMGLTVRRSDGEKLTIREYAKREMLVLIGGCGCYIPFVDWLCWLLGFYKERKGALSWYDKKLNTVVLATRRSGNIMRLFGAIISLLYIVTVAQYLYYPFTRNNKQEVAPDPLSIDELLHRARLGDKNARTSLKAIGFTDDFIQNGWR